MVKRIGAALLAVLLLLLWIPALAEEGITDECGLLSPSAVRDIQEEIRGIREKYAVDVVILTTDRVPKNRSEVTYEQTEKYADEYYDQKGRGLGEDKAGLLYLIDMNNRLPYILTHGKVIDLITDSRLEELHTVTLPHLMKEDYDEAVRAMLEHLKTYLSQGRQEGSFRYDGDTGEQLTRAYNALTRTELIAAIAGGLLSAGIIPAVVCVRYKMKLSTYRFDRETQSGVKLTANEQTLVRENVTRSRISSGGGGSRGSSGGSFRSGLGSATHSSGGHSHGGGAGRHF